MNRRVAVAVLVAVVGLAAFVVVWFEPQALLFDRTAAEAAPEGAVPLAVTETDPDAVPSSTTPPTPAVPAAATAAPAQVPGPDAAPDTSVPPDTTVAPATTTAPPPPQPTQLISIDHGTSGTVSVLVGLDGTRFLRFEGLDTDNGPDLKVYLSANSHDGPEGSFDDVAVDLGQLKANKGDQNYVIDGDVDLSAFNSVVIWCDRFNSAFGAAPLPC